MLRHKCLFIGIAIAGALWLAAPAQSRVLVVQSYHAEYAWSRDLQQAIESVLNAGGIEHRVFFMDTKRKPSQAWKTESGQKAMAEAEAYKPKVIIAVDDNAQAFFVAKYKSKIPVVFCGVNADPDHYGYPSGRITGILERSYADQVLGMLQLIVPGATSVAFVIDDSATANLVLPRIRAQAAAGKLPLKVTGFVQPTTFSEWQKVIRKYNADTAIGAYLIPLYHTVKIDGSDRSMTASEVMAWTVENTNKPIAGFWPFSADDGALCAVVVDPREHGKIAALMAKQILAGKSPGQLPMLTNKDGFVIVNLRSAAKLGIDVPFDVLQSADKIIE